MGSFNKVILMGNLTRDPELRYTPQGTAVTDLSLAINTVRGGKGQDRKEETVFIDVTVWDKMAENCSEYLAKGRSVLVEGRLQEDRWEDRQSGEKRRKIKVVANNVQFVGGRDDSGGGGGSSDRSKPTAPRNEQNLDNDFGDGEEIPF